MKPFLVIKCIKLSCLCLMIPIFQGCGARQVKPPKDTVCKIGIKRLKQKLGPEFGRIVQKLPIYRPKRAVHGCALTYRRLAEETPEELPAGEMGDFQVDDRLAIVMGSKRAPRFRVVPGSVHAPGPVQVKMRATDVNGDGVADFIIQESASIPGETMGYKGLRIFDGSPKRGQEILSLHLRIKTPEGLELIPRWRTFRNPRGSFLELSGGGKIVRYRYDPARRRFVKFTAPPKAVAASPSQKIPPGGKKISPALPKGKTQAPAKTPKLKKPKKPDVVLPFL